MEVRMRFERREPVSAGGAHLPAPPADCIGPYYTVQPTDTLYSLAERFNTTVDALMAANPQVTDRDRIYAGQVLCIPITIERVPRLLSLDLLDRRGQPLPAVGRTVQVTGVTLIRASFDVAVDRVTFLLIRADGGEQLLATRRAEPASPVVEFRWRPEAGSDGRLYVIACLDGVCRLDGGVRVAYVAAAPEPGDDPEHVPADSEQPGDATDAAAGAPEDAGEDGESPADDAATADPETETSRSEQREDGDAGQQAGDDREAGAEDDGGAGDGDEPRSQHDA